MGSKQGLPQLHVELCHKGVKLLWWILLFGTVGEVLFQDLYFQDQGLIFYYCSCCCIFLKSKNMTGRDEQILHLSSNLKTKELLKKIKEKKRVGQKLELLYWSHKF